ncbi:MAG: hypothetical protein IKM05_03330 [Clostridia bacterium]|nr:hypothetical protein [Clostridia bacterium]
MQRGKTMTYATAGVQMSAGIEMNVRSHVYIPDAEAGSEYSRDYFQAGNQVERKKEITISRNRAAVMLLVLAAVLALVIGIKALSYAQLSGTYSDTMGRIEAIHQQNINSTEELAKARDSHRIRYRATTEFGMVPADAVESIPVVAPQTRPNQNTNGLTAEHPFADGYGMLSGSR